MSDVRIESPPEMVPVSALNQYLYCPRRYWYYRFFGPGDRSPSLVEGRVRHQNQSQSPNGIRERYLRAESLGLYGRVDMLENTDETGEEVPHPIPVERKRGSSGRVYRNDEIQVSAYGLLIEHALHSVETVDYGVIYLYETDERHRIPLTEERRDAVRQTRDAIRQLRPDDPPSIVDNRNKCSGCSVRHHCQPETEAYINQEAGSVHSGGGD